MVIPDVWEVKMLELGNADVPFESHIERQHMSILETCLVQFVGYGSGKGGGSFGLSRDSSNLFLMRLNAMADWLCDNVNQYMMRDDRTRPPRVDLRCGPCRRAGAEEGLCERPSRTIVTGHRNNGGSESSVYAGRRVRGGAEGVTRDPWRQRRTGGSPPVAFPLAGWR